MLSLRPFKNSDAKIIAAWCKNEAALRKWSADRFESFPISETDIIKKYIDNNGDCAESDNFYPMTAYDKSGIIGHLILRYTGGDRYTLRLGFVIIDDTKRGYGYGKEMIKLALKYSFEILHAKKVTIGVFENNLPAYRCYKSAGFQEIPAGKPEAFHILGKSWKIIELEISRSDYQQLSLPDMAR